MSKNNSVVGVWDKFLNIIEKGGNLLPHPATLFFIFAVLIVAASGVASWAGIEVQHPAKDEMIKPVNLFSIDGIHYILTSLVVNFTSFAPLGTVLVALLGIGVAEGSGLMGTALRLIVLKAPKKILTFVIVFSGVMSNAASEVGYVLLIPLAAIIFLGSRKASNSWYCGCVCRGFRGLQCKSLARNNRPSSCRSFPGSCPYHR